MRKNFIYLLTIIIFQNIWSQNGRMIIPSEISNDLIYRMKEMGANLTADNIYSPDKTSINDAVIQFNGGCTGEIVSPKGLILTNHHCGYGAIQSHSTFEHNYVKDGFWSQSFEEELPNPGMYVTFVRKIEDVTSQVLAGIDENASDSERQSMIQKNINRLKNSLPKKDWQEIEIKSFFDGNSYYAFTVENYKDIRLVAAPPSSIGKFGADTDNWMWPRHTGDFSVFRIYADKNNRPAEYSPDNVPYQTDAFFKISVKPKKAGDFFLIYGFPGRTQEYLPAVAVQQKVEVLNPARINTRKTVLDVMKSYMSKNDTIKLQYTAKYARIANYWKKWIGENQGIRRSGAIDKKKEFEKFFLSQVDVLKMDPDYKNIFDEFDKLYQQNKDIELARNYFIEIFYLNNDLLKRAFSLYNLKHAYKNQGKEAFNELQKKYTDRLAGSFKNYNAVVDKDIFIALMNLYAKNMPEKYKNSIFKYNKLMPFLAMNIYDNSVLNDPKALKKLLKKNPKKFIKMIDEDPGYSFAEKFIKDYYQKIAPDYQAIRTKINSLQKKYMKGIQQVMGSRPLYPDANGTLRISYGVIKGYEPRDAVYYYPFSHVKGIIEKYIPGDYEFDVHEKLIDLYRKKEFKPYSNTGEMPVNFLGTAHTTGGNSGSPAINSEGDLIGINFDRVWEGTMSDLYYDKKICRNIMVDINYVLFVIDKIGNDKRLIDEMIIKK